MAKKQVGDVRKRRITEITKEMVKELGWKAKQLDAMRIEWDAGRGEEGACLRLQQKRGSPYRYYVIWAA
jgi:hypothetical protein